MSDKIILTVPDGTKARWVSQSQAQGKKLSDWLCEAVERSAKKATERIEQLENAIGYALDVITQREWFEAGRPGIACPDFAEVRNSLRGVLADKDGTVFCARCKSLVLAPDGPGFWKCHRCDLLHDSR